MLNYHCQPTNASPIKLHCNQTGCKMIGNCGEVGEAVSMCWENNGQPSRGSCQLGQRETAVAIC